MPEFRAGDELETIDKDIDQGRIMKWAELSGDFNRLHVDPEFAGRTRFGGTIAHGPMSLAFLNELMTRVFGLAWASAGRLIEVRFRAPVRPGERVTVGGRVRSVREEGGRRVAECEVFVRKPDGEEAVTGLAEAPLEGGGS
ncbi:MAG: MaoC family dehydratase [Proteobacteria bacterium]|nr:MaoC family dehydratase [Pseudomonadota bacterium]